MPSPSGQQHVVMMDTRNALESMEGEKEGGRRVWVFVDVGINLRLAEDGTHHDGPILNVWSSLWEPPGSGLPPLHHRVKRLLFITE
ncbi:hypothetical protein EYF80_003648 [Liparis tanakae]|uniref:Uncharacterized protein n=1 Tax=Liparis tanakae TaxID=230148 RepID=A0A4Z2J8J5_9TELE|nr:hypothetical protein EYF80_003648 [Liparis tanakae]